MKLNRQTSSRITFLFLISVADQTHTSTHHARAAQLNSIHVTMESKAAKHILITVLTTTLAVLVNAAPASINHAEVSRNSFYR